MKGMIFTEFLDMVDERFGLAAKHQVIRSAQLDHDGAYTSIGNYDVQELVRMLMGLSQATGKPPAELLVAFGERIFDHFTRHHPRFFSDAKDCFEFLSRIESYIHVEVRKLYPDAQLPSFTYPHRDERMLVMEYASPRPLAAFAEGLVRAAIAWYGEPIGLHGEDLSGGRGMRARFTLTRTAAPLHG